jgi:hypothetical protein
MEQDTGAGLGWALAIIAVAAIFVGGIAQSWKRRTGAAWGCAAFFLMIPAFLFLYFAIAPTRLDLFKTNSGWEALGLVTAIFGVIILLIIIATLPQRTSK